MVAIVIKKGAMELKFFPGIKYKMLMVLNKWLSARWTKTLFVIYTMLLFLIAVLPINSSGSAINHTFVVSIRLDYLLHCVIFIPWVFLLWKFTSFNFKMYPLKTIALLLGGILFAFVMEAIQYFLPYRAFNINDLLANGLGVLLGFMIVLSFERAGIPFSRRDH